MMCSKSLPISTVPLGIFMWETKDYTPNIYIYIYKCLKGFFFFFLSIIVFYSFIFFCELKICCEFEFVE